MMDVCVCVARNEQIQSGRRDRSQPTLPLRLGPSSPCNTRFLGDVFKFAISQVVIQHVAAVSRNINIGQTVALS